MSDLLNYNPPCIVLCGWFYILFDHVELLPWAQVCRLIISICFTLASSQLFKSTIQLSADCPLSFGIIKGWQGRLVQWPLSQESVGLVTVLGCSFLAFVGQYLLLPPRRKAVCLPNLLLEGLIYTLSHSVPSPSFLNQWGQSRRQSCTSAGYWYLLGCFP